MTDHGLSKIHHGCQACEWKCCQKTMGDLAKTDVSPQLGYESAKTDALQTMDAE